MRIHHVVRQHVQINHQIHTIQVMQVVIAVDGHVMHHTIRVEVHVHHVLHDSIVVHDRVVVVVVQINHQIHTIQVMQVVIAVDGHVILDIIKIEILVLKIVHLKRVVLCECQLQKQIMNVIKLYILIIEIDVVDH